MHGCLGGMRGCSGGMGGMCGCSGVQRGMCDSSWGGACVVALGEEVCMVALEGMHGCSRGCC